MKFLRGIVAQTTKALPNPCILGVVDATMLARREWPAALWTCGGVELRADGMPPEAIADAVSDFDTERVRRGFKGPVLLTLRLRRDGGAWEDAAAATRNAVWESLPPGTCDWVDLEVEEAARIADSAPEALDSLRSSGVKILLSHHAFAPEEPAVWDALLVAMRAFRPDGVKFAVAVQDDAHAEALLDFARRVAPEFPDSCVFGMGAPGSGTRLASPLLGCPYTYGYLGKEPGAPGQLPAASMRAFFADVAADASRPGLGTPSAEWLAWASAAWARGGYAG
jgi:3-dehydroquinate dehydratase type I